MDAEVKKKLDNFFKASSERSLKKGEMLIFAGEDPGGVFRLLSGRIKQYGVSHGGDEVVLNIFKPMSFFPMSYALNKSPNKYFYEALEDTKYQKVSAEAATEFLGANPDVTLDLLRRLYVGIDGMLERNFYLMAGSATNRIIVELVIEAKRFGQKEPDGSITIKVSQQELASRVGLSRETISRDIKKLPGVRVKHGSINITDLSELEQTLSEV
ncbi:MAG TPA: Crp/Fnr family transcriptional regulator [Candidatus Saccharimonadales bacterium]|nr:Crp/Fnr family transcriptional regulator [Candidatus Saccharimonadales bacterium]